MGGPRRSAPVLLREFRELPAAVLEILELAVAGAAGAEQDDLGAHAARQRLAAGAAAGDAEVVALADRDKVLIPRRRGGFRSTCSAVSRGMRGMLRFPRR